MKELEKQVLKDIENAKIRFRKPQRVVKLYDSFFDTYEQLLETCKEQRIAKEYEKLAITLHTIKGSSSNIGMSLINSFVIDLELKAKQHDDKVDYIKDIYTLKMYGKLYKNNIK